LDGWYQCVTGVLSVQQHLFFQCSTSQFLFAPVNHVLSI
jgi:hypothetical protein